MSTNQPFKPVIFNSIKLKLILEQEGKEGLYHINTNDFKFEPQLLISISQEFCFLQTSQHSTGLPFPLLHVFLSNVLFLFCQGENQSHFLIIKQSSLSYLLQRPTDALLLWLPGFYFHYGIQLAFLKVNFFYEQKTMKRQGSRKKENLNLS